MPNLNELRAEFEAMMRKEHPAFPLKRVDADWIEYLSAGTQHMWKGYQAARRQHGNAAQAVAWRYQRDTQSNPGVPDGEWKFMAHGDDALDLQGKRLGWKPNDSYHCWEPLFAAPPVADAEGVKADLIEGLKLLLEGRGCGFRGQFADDAYSEAADALIDRIAALSCRPAAAPEGEYPYDALFRAIGDATKIESTSIAISVKAFVQTLLNKGYKITAAAPEATPGGNGAAEQPAAEPALFRAAGQGSKDSATCAWNLQDDDSGLWQSSCGQAWTFIDGGPVENSVSFCHGCGKPVELDAAKAKGEQQ